MDVTTRSDPKARSRVLVAAVSILGLLMGVFYAAAELASYDWDPVGVVSIGEDEPEIAAYARELLDRDVPLLGGLGHDGRFFFIQAMDPLFLNPDEHAHLLDRPTYRAQRMLYPSLAGSVRPFLGPEGVAWAMVVLNVVAFGVGTSATAFIAQRYGASPWWGLAFALNPGVRFELDIDGGGAVAFAAIMVAVALVHRRSTWPVAAALTVAVLAREVMLVCAFGLAFAKGIGSLRRRTALVLSPIAAAGSWWVYVRERLGDLPGGPGIQELGLPFKGFLGALDVWAGDPDMDLLIGPFFLILALLMIVRSLRRWTVLELPAAGFAALALVLTQPVWLNYFDISRALIPLPTFFALSLAVSISAGPGLLGGRSRDRDLGEASEVPAIETSGRLDV